MSGLSTRTEAVWTFSSQQAGEDGQALPLWGVRYSPAVDVNNVVKRRPVTVLPVRLEAVPDAPVGTLRRVEVMVSGDDGAHWAKADVRRTGIGRYVAVFATPAEGHVSLKATAADSAGNAIEQTILRAYALR